MATIDKLDLSIYNLYAVRTRMVEQINQQFRLQEAATIPPQIEILNVFQQTSQLELALGEVRPNSYNPWAVFKAPTGYFSVRRSPFSSFRVAPSLGSLEQQNQLEMSLQAISCKTEEEEKEKQTLLGCFGTINKINGWMGYIVGRVGQFLQG